MLSMADRYCNTKFNMSNVEFHRVTTSRGILRSSSFNFSSVWNHSGKVIVVEWIIANAILRSWQYQSISSSFQDQKELTFTSTNFTCHVLSLSSAQVSGNIFNASSSSSTDIRFIPIFFVFSLRLALFKIYPFGEVPQRLLSFVQCSISPSFRHVKLMYHPLCNQCDNMVETSGTVGIPFKWHDGLTETINHCVVGSVVARYGQALCVTGEQWLPLIMPIAYLVSYPEIMENSCKCSGEVHARVWLCNLDKIQQNAHGGAICLEMDRDCYKSLVVWWGPSVCCKTEIAFMFLEVRQFELYVSTLGAGHNNFTKNIVKIW